MKYDQGTKHSSSSSRNSRKKMAEKYTPCLRTTLQLTPLTARLRPSPPTSSSPELQDCCCRMRWQRRRQRVSVEFYEPWFVEWGLSSALAVHNSETWNKTTVEQSYGYGYARAVRGLSSTYAQLLATLTTDYRHARCPVKICS